MKNYTVTQKCRCCFTAPSLDGSSMSQYRFSPDIPVGTYTESDFKALVGEEYLKSTHFTKHCELGWIKVTEVKDVTKKVVAKAKETL